MKFSLEINCDNDAFQGEEGDETRVEVSEILSRLAIRLVSNDREEGVLLDSNGNFVGSWSFDEIEESDDE